MASEEDHAMDDQAHAPGKQTMRLPFLLPSFIQSSATIDAIEEMVKADMTRVMVRSVQQGLEPFLEKMDQMYQRISKMEARSTPQQRASTADPEEADDEDDDDEPHSHPRRAMTKGEKDFHVSLSLNVQACIFSSLYSEDFSRLSRWDESATLLQSRYLRPSRSCHR